MRLREGARGVQQLILGARCWAARARGSSVPMLRSPYFARAKRAPPKAARAEGRRPKAARASRAQEKGDHNMGAGSSLRVPPKKATKATKPEVPRQGARRLTEFCARSHVIWYVRARLVN